MIDYNVVFSSVKVYTKKYSRKGKDGKKVTATTVQNSIPLPKDIPFSAGESVVVMKESDYQKLMDNDKVEDDEINTNETVVDLIEDLRVANHKNLELSQEMQGMAVEIARLDNSSKHYRQLFNILNSYYERLMNDAVDTTVDATIVEINRELKDTNILQRIRGLQIVNKPDIDEGKIMDKLLKDLDAFIQENNLLE